MLLSTAFIAAVLIGGMTSEIPMPMRTKPGSRVLKSVSMVRNDCQNSETETSAMPIVMSGRAPIRSASSANFRSINGQKSGRGHRV